MYQRVAALALLLVTAIWGSTFFIIKDTLNYLDPLDYLALRFSIGAIVPTIILWHRLKKLRIEQWAAGIFIGIIYGVAQICQTYGLMFTSASASGFISGMYVIITPLLLWIIYKAQPTISTWLAVILAFTGMAILSLGGGSFGGIGEILTLGCATLYAFHIIFLDRRAGEFDALCLAVLQLIGIALVVFPLALPGGIAIPADIPIWLALLYMALAAGLGTMLLQTWAQRHIQPTKAALLMTFEPVFASSFAIIFGGESLSDKLLIGGGLIFLSTLVGIRSGNTSTKFQLRFRTFRESLIRNRSVAGSRIIPLRRKKTPTASKHISPKEDSQN